MLPLERKQDIVKLIKENKSVVVLELSKLYDVTEETIRRDLEKLEKEGIVKKTYGGAVLVENEISDPSFQMRSTENIKQKEEIGKLVAELLEDGDVVMVDSSTTSLQTTKYIDNYNNLTFITNALNVVLQLSEKENHKVLASGGILREKSLSFIGPWAEKMIGNYCADKAIISCKGLDLNKGIMESNDMEAEIKKQMIKSSSQIILAIDDTKFGKQSMCRLFDYKDVNIVVTNKKPEQKWLEFFEDMDIKVKFPNDLK